MGEFIEPVTYTDEVEIFVTMYFKNMFKGNINIEIEYEPRSITYCIAVTHTYNNIFSKAKATISCMFTTDKMLETLHQMKEELLNNYKTNLAQAQNPLW